MAGSSPVLAGVLAFMMWTRWEHKQRELPLKTEEIPKACPLLAAGVGPAAVGAAIERVDRALNGIESSLAGIQQTLVELQSLHKDGGA
jgi:hypothetical protein